MNLYACVRVSKCILCAHTSTSMLGCVRVCMHMCACARVPRCLGSAQLRAEREGDQCQAPVLPPCLGNSAVSIVHPRPDFSVIDGLAVTLYFYFRKYSVPRLGPLRTKGSP